MSVPYPQLCYDPVENSPLWLAVQRDARKTLIALEFKGIWPIYLVCIRWSWRNWRMI